MWPKLATAALAAALLVWLSGLGHCEKVFYRCGETSLQSDILASSFIVSLDELDLLEVLPGGVDRARTVCRFSAPDTGARYFVSVYVAKAADLGMTLTSGGKVLLNSSALRDWEAVVATRAGRLTVALTTRLPKAPKAAVHVSSIGACPPDWRRRGNQCFGTGAVYQRLAFSDAQASCRAMGANLLHLPFSYFGDLRDLRSELNSEALLSGSWVGVVRSKVGQFAWLDGTRFAGSQVSCNGAACPGIFVHACGALAPAADLWYAIAMRNCSERRQFVCYAPAGGASFSYALPPSAGGVGVGVGVGLDYTEPNSALGLRKMIRWLNGSGYLFNSVWEDALAGLALCGSCVAVGVSQYLLWQRRSQDATLTLTASTDDSWETKGSTGDE